MRTGWFKQSYRRNLVDMHIPDWDEQFLSEFNPERYVDMLVLSNVKTALVYANSHVGHCYWPTQSGHMHNGLKGKDILGVLINRCHERGMSVVVYYSLIFNNWAYENHPEWRMIDVEGREVRVWGGRYKVCCPNSPYRDFVVTQITELCKGYDFEGIWPDMTFWPVICYCPHCRKRYQSETGEDIPEVVNWEDPRWVKFQRKREAWLAEFAHLVTSTIKKLRPSATVSHQSAAFIWDWQMGGSLELAKASDFMSGDFYGDSLQQSFFCKLFYNLGNDVPFEFMTSRCINLHEHTTTKPQELLEIQAYSSLANGGAFCFIDAIDPVGTMDRKVYEMMGEIFRKTEAYERYLGGKPCADVAIYYSFESRVDLADNGKRVNEVFLNVALDRKLPPHSRAAISAAKSLLNTHIPFTVITKKQLSDLSSYQVIILPNVLAMDEEEISALRDFVASGGSLYVSKYSSLFTKEGRKREDFGLSEPLGISYLGETKEKYTYIAPTEEGTNFLPRLSPKYPLSVHSSQIMVRTKGLTRVLATITLPYTDPSDPDYFSSIHSNPPGVSTEYPSVTLNEYGKGKVLYVAADLETMGFEVHRKIFTSLVRMLSPKPFSFEVDAPKPVEVTLFRQEDKNRDLISLLNFQTELPNIPVKEIRLRVKHDRRRNPKRLLLLPEERDIAFEVRDGCVEFVVSELGTFSMLALEYL